MSKIINILRSTLNNLYSNKIKHKKAFTLAEVMITLTIIGVVSAMTIPTITKSHQKQVVETRVLNFYSTMQNAIKLSTVENGPIEEWAYDKNIFTFSGSLATFEQNKAYIEKYLAPYLKITDITNSGYNNKAMVKLQNGSSFLFNFQNDIGSNLVLIAYFIDGNKVNRSTKNIFTFSMSQERPFKPFDLNWNGDRKDLFTHSTWGCGTGIWDGRNNPLYCTKVLELNNWKIPDDYPW